MPDLLYNLLSVSKAVEAGKMVDQLSNSGYKSETNHCCLYHLNCLTERQHANAADNQSQHSKEDVWHQRYGHLGVQNLVKEELVDGFDFNSL